MFSSNSFARSPPLIVKLKPVSSGLTSYAHVNLTEWLLGTAFTLIDFAMPGDGQISVVLIKCFNY